MQPGDLKSETIKTQQSVVQDAEVLDDAGQLPVMKSTSGVESPAVLMLRQQIAEEEKHLANLRAFKAQRETLTLQVRRALSTESIGPGANGDSSHSASLDLPDELKQLLLEDEARLLVEQIRTAGAEVQRLGAAVAAKDALVLREQGALKIDRESERERKRKGRKDKKKKKQTGGVAVSSVESLKGQDVADTTEVNQEKRALFEALELFLSEQKPHQHSPHSAETSATVPCSSIDPEWLKCEPLVDADITNANVPAEPVVDDDHLAKCSSSADSHYVDDFEDDAEAETNVER